MKKQPYSNNVQNAVFNTFFWNLHLRAVWLVRYFFVLFSRSTSDLVRCTGTRLCVWDSWASTAQFFNFKGLHATAAAWCFSNFSSVNYFLPFRYEQAHRQVSIIAQCCKHPSLLYAYTNLKCDSSALLQSRKSNLNTIEFWSGFNFF